MNSQVQEDSNEAAEATRQDNQRKLKEIEESYTEAERMENTDVSQQIDKFANKI